MKSIKTIAMCFSLIFITISSSFIVPIAYAQAGTCASAYEKEKTERPTIYYSLHKIQNQETDGYYVLVYRPKDYGKDIEIEVKGLSDSWRIVEFYPNTVSRDGNKIVAKDSTSFIIVGEPSSVSCSCVKSPYSVEDSGQNEMKNWCEGECANPRAACESNGGCIALKELVLEPSDKIVKAFPITDPATLATAVGIFQNTGLQELNKDASEALFKVSTSLLMMVFGQIQMGTRESPLIYFGNEITIIDPDPNRPWPDVSSISDLPQDWVKKFPALGDALHYIRDKYKNFPTEIGFLLFGDRGQVNTMVILEPNSLGTTEIGGITYQGTMSGYIVATQTGHVYVRQAGDATISFKNKLGKDFIGNGQTHVIAESWLSGADVYSFATRTKHMLLDPVGSFTGKVYEPLSYDVANPVQIVISYKDGFNGFYILDQEFAVNYWKSYYQLNAQPPIVPDANNPNYNQAVIAASVVDGEPSKVQIISIEWGKMVSQDEWWKNYNKLTDDITEGVGSRDVSRLRTALSELDNFESAISPRWGKKLSSYMKTSIDSNRQAINRVLGNIDDIPGGLYQRFKIIGGGAMDPMLTFSYEFQIDLLEYSNELDGMGYKPPQTTITDFEISVDNLKSITDVMDDGLNHPSIAETRSAVGGKKNLISAVRNSPKWGPILTGINVAMLASPFIQKYAEKLGGAYGTMVAQTINAINWADTIASVISTAAVNLGYVETLPTFVEKLFFYGKGSAELVKNLVTSVFVMAITTTTLEVVSCKYLDPKSPSCGCVPDPFYGGLEMEMEKTEAGEGQKVKFVLYGMENCNNKIGRVQSMKKTGENTYQTDLSVGWNGVVGDCSFKEYGAGRHKIFCCEGEIGTASTVVSGGPQNVKLKSGTYVLDVYVDNSMNTFHGKKVQTLTIGGESTPKEVNCVKESSTSWLCTSPENTMLVCNSDTVDTNSPWTCLVK